MKTFDRQPQHTATAIFQYGAPFVLAVGTFGNVMSIVITRRMHWRQPAMGVYIIALAVSDMIVLTGLLNEWIQYLTGFKVDIRRQHILLCKVHPWLYSSSCIESSWLVVLMTAERLISVWYPHKVKRICTPMKAGISVAVIVTLSLVINSFQLSFFTLTKTANAGNLTCRPAGLDRLFYEEEWIWVDLVLVSLLPSAIIIMGNALLLYKMEHTSSGFRSHRKRSSLTGILLAVSLFFLLSTSPLFWYRALYPHSLRVKLSLQEEINLKVPKAVTSLLFYTNSAMNFYLYCLSGSKFRAELMQLLRRRGPSLVAFTSTTPTNVVQPSAQVFKSKASEARVTGCTIGAKSELDDDDRSAKRVRNSTIIVRSDDGLGVGTNTFPDNTVFSSQPIPPVRRGTRVYRSLL